MPRRPWAGPRDAAVGGADFLLARQDDDGLWRDFWTPAGPASIWPSAYVGSALRSDGCGGTWLDRLSGALLRHQREDGGWGYHEAIPSDADSTAWGLLALGGLPTTAAVCVRAEACLAVHQRRGGGVATYAAARPVREYTGLSRLVPFGGWCRPHNEVTAVAGRAWRIFGSGEARARAARAWEWVRARQHADGSWSSYWWTASHVATEQAAALSVLMRDTAAADRATGWVLRQQRPDGGWGDPADRTSSPFLTALSVSVLAEFGAGSRVPLERAVEALTRLQAGDGGWPASATLQIPLPPDRHPSHEGGWRPIRFGPGLVARDEQRLFTTATCVAALSRACTALGLRSRTVGGDTRS